MSTVPVSNLSLAKKTSKKSSMLSMSTKKKNSALSMSTKKSIQDKGANFFFYGEKEILLSIRSSTISLDHHSDLWREVLQPHIGHRLYFS
jgi:hypothetical protein